MRLSLQKTRGFDHAAELQPLAESVVPLVPLPSVLVEVSDLVFYFATGSTPTGIQRVQQELAWELIQQPRFSTVRFVVYDQSIQKWRIVPATWLSHLIDTARRFRTGGQSWEGVYGAFKTELSTFPLQQFESGDWLLNVGASWSLASYFIQIRQLRRRGVRFAVFLHDTIPIRHPSYFDDQHMIEHTHWLANVRNTADLVICNSEATRADYFDLAKPDAREKVLVCRLDATWVTRVTSVESEVAAADILGDHGIFDDEFVLCVGTIEPRKNHLALIHVWDKLRQKHSGHCPKLICVGRVGWKSDAVIAQARALGLLDNGIYFVGAVSDEILATLYRKCLFSIYVSYYEGWGLPISESLQVGKVCIAGSNSSLKEAGAGLALHVDERSETSIYDAVITLLEQPAKLSALNLKIRQQYRGRTWDQLATQIIDQLGPSRAEKDSSGHLSEFQMNTVYKFGRRNAILEFGRPQAAEVFCLGQTWHRPEEWGAWTSKENAELGFRIAADVHRPTILLGIVSPPGGARLTVALNGKNVYSLSDFSGARVVRLPLESLIRETSRTGAIPVRLRVTVSRTQNMKEVEGSQDTRHLGAGFRFIAGFDGSAMLERLEFLEMLATGEFD